MGSALTGRPPGSSVQHPLAFCTGNTDSNEEDTPAMAKTPAKPMTKTALIAHLAEKHELTKAQAKAILEDLVAVAVKETKKHGAFTIGGFLKVTKKKRPARMGRNPATGESIKIKAKTVLKIKPLKAFADMVIPPKK